MEGIRALDASTVDDSDAAKQDAIDVGKKEKAVKVGCATQREIPSSAPCRFPGGKSFGSQRSMVTSTALHCPWRNFCFFSPCDVLVLQSLSLLACNAVYQHEVVGEGRGQLSQNMKKIASFQDGGARGRVILTGLIASTAFPIELYLHYSTDAERSPTQPEALVQPSSLFPHSFSWPSPLCPDGGPQNPSVGDVNEIADKLKDALDNHSKVKPDISAFMDSSAARAKEQAELQAAETRRVVQRQEKMDESQEKMDQVRERNDVALKDFRRKSLEQVILRTFSNRFLGGLI